MSDLGRAETHEDIPESPGSGEEQGAERVSLTVVDHRKQLPQRGPNVPLMFFVFAGVVVGLDLLRTIFGRGVTYSVLGLTFAIALFIAIYYGFVRRRQRRRLAVRLPVPIVGARLTAFGRAEELWPLAELDDVPFEPVIIERIITAHSIVFTIVLGAIAAGVLTGVLRYLLPNLPVNPFAVMYPLGLLILWCIQRLRPTYYRIVPGRIDVMRFSVLTNRAKIIKKMGLRHTRISALFDSQHIEFEPEGGRLSKIELFGLSEPRAFVRALFQAALSTHTAPPLPDDSLLG